MRGILTLTLPALLLLPDAAWAAGADPLGDISATLIAYSKVALMVGGLGLVVRLVFQSNQGRDTSSTWWLLIASIILPAILLAVWSHLPDSEARGSAIASGSRSYLEAFLADAGLLNANQLGAWQGYRLALLSVLFASLAGVLIKASSMDEAQAVAAVKGWAVPTVLIVAIFWPGWTIPGAATSESVVARLQGQGGQTQTQPVPFSMSESDQILSKMSQANLRLSHSADAQIPVALSFLNAAMDEATQKIAILFGTGTFSNFGMIDSRLTINSIHFSFPASSDLEKRMSWFVGNCYLSALQANNTNLTGPAKKETANEFNPFSKNYLPYYRKHQNCQTMLSGGYKFAGEIYKYRLADEVLGVLAFGNQQIKENHKWQSVDQAIAAAPTLRQAVFNLPESKFYFAPMADALVARAMQGSFARFPGGQNSAQAIIQGQRTGQNDNWFTSLAGLMGGQAYSLVAAAKGAAEGEVVSLKIPLWMGLLQCLLLSCFPIVYLLSVLPGRGASWIGYYLSMLFYAKSYIIPWALISQVDTWYKTLDGMTVAQNLVWAQIVQQSMLYSPLLMGVLIFGPIAGHQMMSRGGGAA